MLFTTYIKIKQMSTPNCNSIEFNKTSKINNVHKYRISKYVAFTCRVPNFASISIFFLASLRSNASWITFSSRKVFRCASGCVLCVVLCLSVCGLFWFIHCKTFKAKMLYKYASANICCVKVVFRFYFLLKNLYNEIGSEELCCCCRRRRIYRETSVWRKIN